MEIHNVLKLSAFFVSVMFSLILVGLAVTMVVKNDNAAVWVPVITGVVNLWIPSPVSMIKKPRLSTDSAPSTPAQVLL